ncbi:hypothetical protein MELE44368_23755 [Mycolicibacterium elephantis DSM 44368]|uniref:Uncharacterized protein n=1 Tax=Mycolicibacterium elephantis DSM 44368 TaxID=1335622 RepID=A0A439DQR6_9MYCO|nr:hypothetical protein MELE44368_23755 [Mycolicibacterium elephantis DSM 44368]
MTIVCPLRSETNAEPLRGVPVPQTARWRAVTMLYRWPALRCAT